MINEKMVNEEELERIIMAQERKASDNDFLTLYENSPSGMVPIEGSIQRTVKDWEDHIKELRRENEDSIFTYTRLQIDRFEEIIEAAKKGSEKEKKFYSVIKNTNPE